MTELGNDSAILLIGDSITDCDRDLTTDGLGNGYVKYLADMLIIREPQKRIKIINRGISGNRVTDLQKRWQQDVLQHQPDWLAVKIGINDVHSFLNREPGAVSSQTFAEVLDDLISQTRSTLPECQIILIDPFYLRLPAAANEWESSVLELLAAYIEIVHRVSQQHSTRLVETHRLFQELLRYQPPEVFCPEPVHPNSTGHLAIAEMVYRALSVEHQS